MKRVAVFGSGLSSAFIYAACLQHGAEAHFYTDRPFTLDMPEFGHIIVKWVPPELQYVKMPHRISHFSMGSKNDYLKKMGRENDPNAKTTFPEDGRNEFFAYHPRDVMEKYMPPEDCVRIGRYLDKDIELLARDYDWTFVTFPLQQSRDTSKMVFYWSYVHLNHDLDLPNIAIYNGSPSYAWTRFTQYWNIMSWEYSHAMYPGNGEPPPSPSRSAEPKRIGDIAVGVPEYQSPFNKVTLVGRWARWRKDVLSHDGYHQANSILEEL